MNRFILIISVLIFCSGCEETIKYKHQDKPSLVKCQGADSQLLNEAMYSFFDDITVYYRKKDSPQNLGISTLEAFANYIYTGALGEADYKNIVSEHSKQIVKLLKEDKRLWNMGRTYSNLNHNSEFVSCLIHNIKDDDLKTSILSLKEINSVSPKLLADVFRIHTRNALEDPNYGMYIALDTYYQYLMNLEL